MSAPFDIRELRANIGDDRDTEQALLTMFVESTAESLQCLRDAFPAGENEQYNQLWKTHMHQIKGAALNIAAQKLSALAARAQDSFQAALPEKFSQLEAVSDEFNAVRNYIDTLGARAAGLG